MGRNYSPQEYWNEVARTFDQEADHGLGPPQVLAAWTNLLQRWLPAPPANILDLGCGTGSLSLVMAQLGHTVTAIDFSPAMIAKARAKEAAAGQTITFRTMDAAQPQFPPASFDILVCRHVLWALPETAEVLQRWLKLLRENGRLILIEGFWHTGGGLHSADILSALPDNARLLGFEDLSQTADFWGKDVEDERYAIILTREGNP